MDRHAADFATEEVAAPARFSKRHLYRLLHLSWLAPDITAAIVEGRRPRHLNARKLLRMNQIPLEWDAQRQMLGFS